MGKKSRKKGAASGKNVADKKAHKEKIQERRARVEEKLKEEEEEKDDYGRGWMEDGIEVFDRVWYRLAEEKDFQRGTVMAIDKADDWAACHVLPIDIDVEDQEGDKVLGQCHIVNVYEEYSRGSNVRRDTFNWYPRFDIGEQVMVMNGKAWLPAVVSGHWVTEDGAVHPYQYTLAFDHPPFGSKLIGTVRYDNDSRIILNKALRFDEGDHVLVNFSLSFADPNTPPLHRSSTEKWVRAIVGGLALTTLDDGNKTYRPYQVVLAIAGKPKYNVSHDNDEYIAPVNAEPRERLMNAIENNCSYEHIDYLVNEFGLDCSILLDLLLDKAIEYGSYNALLWLQENIPVNLDTIQDKRGNGCLFQIVQGNYATRFFQCHADAFEQRYKDRPSRNRILILDIARQLGRSSLEHKFGLILCDIVEHKPKVFSCILERRVLRSLHLHFIDPQHKVFEHDYQLTLGTGQRKMLQELTQTMLLETIYDLMSERPWCKDAGVESTDMEDEIRTKLDNMVSAEPRKAEESVWRKFVRDAHFMHIDPDIDQLAKSLLQRGLTDIIRNLVELDGELLNLQLSVRSNADCFEYAQPELLHYEEDFGVKEIMGAIDFAAHGPHDAPLFGRGNREFHEIYLMNIRPSLAMNRLNDHAKVLEDLIENFESMKDDSEGFDVYLKRKLRRLKDGYSLRPRLEMLRYLVSDRSLQPPNAVDAIRWRQCGVLRWLVQQGHVDLQAPANKLPWHGKIPPTFHGKLPVPKEMTVGEYLAFTAVEYDDLQTLQWLVSTEGVPVRETICDGWNILHTCAFFGRAEIAHWLVANQKLNDMLKVPSKRKPTKYFASHIAVDRGFTFLADLLLDWGCPSADIKGKELYQMAKQSRFAHVQEWGSAMELPFGLERDVQHLFQLLADVHSNTDEIMAFISKTECLSSSRWREAGASCCNSCVKSRMSAASVLEKCCSLGDASLVIWLGTKLLTVHDTWFWQNESPFESGSPGKTFHWQWFRFVSEVDTLQEIIGHSWTSDISIADPMELFPPVKQLWNKFGNEPDTRLALEVVRGRLVLSAVFKRVVEKGIEKLRKQLSEGEMVKVVKGTIDVIQTAQRHHALHCFGNRFDFVLEGFISSDGHLLVDTDLDCYSDHENPLRWLWIAWTSRPAELNKFYLVAASEGYDGLLHWSLCGGGQGWDIEKEMTVTRISAYRGHTKLTRIMALDHADASINFQSSAQERLQAAILGAAESGRLDDLELYHDKISEHGGLLSDPLVQSTDEQSRKFEEMHIQSSLIGAVLCGCLKSNKVFESAIISFVSDKCGYEPKDILRAFDKVLGSFRFGFIYLNGLGVFLSLFNSLRLDVWNCRDEIESITEKYIQAAQRERYVEITRRFLALLLNLGLSIQHVQIPMNRNKNDDKRHMVKELQAQQRTVWSRLDPIKKGATLNDIQTAISTGQLQATWYDSQGLRLVHLAAAYNRKDVLQWLVESQLASIDDKDCLGRSVLQVAQDSHAAICVIWIEEKRAAKVMHSFLSSIVHCKEDVERKRKTLHSIVRLQARIRGCATRGKHRAKLLANMEEAQRFQGVWTGLLSSFESNRMSAGQCTWVNLRNQVDDMAASSGISESDLFDTVKVLGEAGKLILVEPEEDQKEPDRVETPSVYQTVIDEDLRGSSPGSVAQETNSTLFVLPGQELFEKILLTKEVIKWLRVADSKYREFFVRRVAQLAIGDRSRILAKRLTGSKTTIYETYLEQKSGFRILWTEKNHGCLLIWYVSKHDSVSRLMGLIDDAESRSTRQLTSAREALSNDGTTFDSRMQCGESDLVMLDPRGHTPLKLYSVGYDELDRLVDDPWKPPLHLTDSEREVVECNGTTLLLGRSGTGKTCCISNRMDYDRYLAGNQACFSQLFVARSRRLRDYVENVVGEGSDAAKIKSEFTTFQTLIQKLEHSARSVVKELPAFLPSQHVDFYRFKRDIWKPTMGIDALISWTSIRSFIKGSIEAVAGRQPLSLEAYLALGKKRCRLSEAQRIAVYNVFQKYQTYCIEGKLWDDCDRISNLLSALSKVEQVSSLDFLDIQYNKLYVDEVQDYTQAEITLFFRLCGPGGLFLAGDPAQSVVEGVEFRFEDIRSVGHYLYEIDRKLIPDKPKVVNVNFRSHTGVLSVAAGILEHLFGAFPDSAKMLSKDRGLFTGPRPSVLHKIELHSVKELITKLEGAVIITHDAAVSNLKERLGYPLVYGVREAKGLEFETVVVLDFFRLLPGASQKPFRDLLLGRQMADVGTTCPEIEGSLKLLYTGVTRCIQRLLFAETARSPSGDAFLRWLTSSTGARSKDDALAVRQTVDDIEAMSRTPDEWKSLGLENAINAEETPDMDESLNWLDKAVYCFGKADLANLARKARTHKHSVTLRNEINHFGSSEGVQEQRDLIELEMETARVSEALISVGLSSETKRLLSCLLPLLSDYSQTKLQGAVLSKLA